MDNKEIRLLVKKTYDIAVKTLNTKVETETGFSIPPLVFTRSKKRFGHIKCYRNKDNSVSSYKELGVSDSVMESYSNHPDFLLEKTGFTCIEDKVLDTICHEIAHMTHWNHSEEHEQLTRLYWDTIKTLGKFTQPVENKTTQGPVKLADLVKDTKKARTILRKHQVEKPGNKWEWEQLPTMVAQLLEGI